MSSLYFFETHKLGAELGSFPPFLVREALRLHDRRPKIVKVYSKMGQTPSEQHQIHSETQFWSLVRHPRIIEIEHVYDEEGFIYIVYEYPEGGDLAALILEQTRTFSEGFAKKIATALLDALIFLHGNGIMHGAVTPANVIFTASAHVPGWADTCKLTSFRVDNARNTTVFQDIQDLAFTVVSTMRRSPGLLSRTFFTPDVLQKAEWSHVTDDFVDFIEQLWYCEEKYRMAETFKKHPWLHSVKSLATEQTDSPAALLLRSVKENADQTIEGTLLFKMREKINGRRQWHKKWGVVRHHVLFLYESEDEYHIDDQHLCQAINLQHKNIFIYTRGRHDFTFGLQDTVKEQTVVWMRFETEFEYVRWKEFLTSRFEKEVADADPRSESNQMKKILAPKNSNFAASLANNLANNIVAAQYRENVSAEAKGDSGTKETKENDDATTRSHAEALVQAVDDVAKEFAKQIEAQASAYVRKSKMLQVLRSNKLENKITGSSFNHSMSPFPSEQKCRTHPAIKWDMRAEELMLVQATGTPVNKPVGPGEQWFVIDATWFKHWITFVASSRRRAPPGPIDNLWMINPLTDQPYEHMIEDSDEIGGDFRRVPPQIWELFEKWYGGGPAISLTGPPTEDTRRWTVHINEVEDEDKDGNLVELLSKLDHPEDIIRSGPTKNDTHLVVDLHHGARRPSLAEMSLLAKVGDFNDGGKDKVQTGLDAIVDSSGSDDEQDSDEEKLNRSETGSTKSSTVYAPLTPSSLAVFRNMDDASDLDDDLEEEVKTNGTGKPKSRPPSLVVDKLVPPVKEGKPKEEGAKPKQEGAKTKEESAAAKKRGSFFHR